MIAADPVLSAASAVRGGTDRNSDSSNAAVQDLLVRASGRFTPGGAKSEDPDSLQDRVKDIPESEDEMKLNRMSSLAATLAVCTMAAAAFGAGEKIKVIETDLWGTGGAGGPFEVQPIGFPANPQGLGMHGAGAGNFVTFCIETDEFLGEGGEYFIQFSDEAKAGGSGGPSPDPLSDATRYLYAHFIRGSLQAELDAWDAHVGPTETFTYGTFASGEALQKAIWYLEEETGGSNNFLVGLATWALANGSLSDLSEVSKVRVMNMWDNANFTGNRQDLLVMIPLPAPVWMGGVGLCGVIGLAFRHRRGSRQHGADLTV